ncbi:A-kinase anchor protein 200 [Harmonia axyridis]|uniref:A-kinase anchor protein 200 n=1 Tax=Harmonia axyridis TaxID=115357 RepID=UPI001E2775A1|nr:A-kinase anchor protein 200 [Harmonia axyridis]XP_045475208.1 A-kinase anchor protein 200 [Harmonia axyridis]
MGARQSKRSVDITTTPKKGEAEAIPVNEDRIEKLGDADVEVVTNGTTAHTDIEFVDKDEIKGAEEKTATEATENGLVETSDGEKTPDTESAAPAAGDQPLKAVETAIEKTSENGEKATETPDSKKQKDKKKKKWSLRSISFSKKDKSKPSKDKEKNGEIGVNEEKEEENTTKPMTETVKTDSKNSIQEEVTVQEATKEEVADKAPDVVEPVSKNELEETKPSENSNDQVNIAENLPEKQEVVELEASYKSEKEGTTTATPTVEEVKEVRNEEVPPPLPNSYPPSQMAVFAESLKDETLSVHQNTVTESLLKQSVDEPSKNESDTFLELNDVKTAAPICIEPSKEEPTIEVPETDDHVELCVTKTSVESPSKSRKSSQNENQSLPKWESKIESPSELPITSDISAEETRISENISSLSDNNEQENTQISSGGDSSPLIVEALPKLEDTVQNISINASGTDFDTNVSEQQSETSNLAETDIQEISNLEFECVPLKIEDTEADFVLSVPTMIEEKIPIVSSAGDVPNPICSETSVIYNDSNLQELKSNINLAASPISQDSDLTTEEPSLDLSAIPEAVGSNKIKLMKENVNILPESSTSIVSTDIDANELIHEINSQKDGNDLITVESIPYFPQKEVEPLCNTDSIADLSTESLPSLPEPSDSVLEPMSLPPLDFVPDPLVDDNIPIESLITKPNETEIEVVLTNGNATNGLNLSPTAENDDSPLPTSLDGPLKQPITPEVSLDASEISQSTEVKAGTVEAVQSEAQ